MYILCASCIAERFNVARYPTPSVYPHLKIKHVNYYYLPNIFIHESHVVTYLGTYLLVYAYSDIPVIKARSIRARTKGKNLGGEILYSRRF